MSGRPVLVTGAGGFLGGHVARALASAGERVRAFSRGPARPWPGAESRAVEWVRGDLCDGSDVRAAVDGVGAVVHCAGWVSLEPDPSGESRRVNVDATAALLDRSEASGVERFVYTSTLWTVAAGTAEHPADEETPWNLDAVRGPYCDTKREAERLVLGRNGSRLATVVICPGMVVGPGDARPTSTGLLLRMAAAPVVFLPGGGIPLVDVRVVASAHLGALAAGRPGTRYVVAGAYLSYRELAGLVRRVSGRPWVVVGVPSWAEGALRGLARLAGRRLARRAGNVSDAAVSGGFLRLHVRGTRADRAFGLSHPDPLRSVFETLDDHRRSGRAPWLTLRPPTASSAAHGCAPRHP